MATDRNEYSNPFPVGSQGNPAMETEPTLTNPYPTSPALHPSHQRVEKTYDGRNRCRNRNRVSGLRSPAPVSGSDSPTAR